MARFKFKFNRNVNIGRVVTKIVVAILALWVGGEILTQVATVMNGTHSPFFKGLTLIGFSTGTGATYCTDGSASECLIGTISNTGLLSVVGLVAIASIVMEFVQIRLR